MEIRAIAPESSEQIQGTLDCSSGLSLITAPPSNTGSNAIFGISLELLQDAGLELFDNFSPFVIYQGEIISSFSTVNSEGVPFLQTSPTFLAATYWGQEIAFEGGVIGDFGSPPGGEIEFYFLNGSDVYKWINPPISTYTMNDVIFLEEEDSIVQLYCTLQLTDYFFEPFDSDTQLLNNEIEFLQSELTELQNSYALILSAYSSSQESLGVATLNISDLETQLAESQESEEESSNLNETLLQLISSLEEADGLLDNLSELSNEEVAQQIQVIQNAINAQPTTIAQPDEKLDLRNIALVALGGGLIISLLKK